MTMYRLNEEQSKIVERVRKIADEQIAPYAADVDAKGRFPREGMDALGHAGFLGLNIPKEKGGMGQGLRVASAVLDELAQRDASLAMVYKMHLCGCASYVAFPQTGERFFAQIVAGKHLSTLAWSEPGSRSHFWAPASQATERRWPGRLERPEILGDLSRRSRRLRGLHADGRRDGCDRYDALPRPEGRRRHASRGAWNGLGMRGNASNPMVLENCTIPSDRALCKRSEGFPTMLGVVLPWFNLGNEAISVGIAEAAVAATTAHMTSRRFSDMNNSRLADLPTLRARLAQMRIETDTGTRPSHQRHRRGRAARPADHAHGSGIEGRRGRRCALV